MANSSLRAAAYVALAATDTILAGRGDRARRLRMLTKPALMPTLAAAFLGSGHPRPGVPRGATVAAQALSGTGDVALLGSTERAFLTGLGSFFGAHVAYLVGFTSVRDRRGGWLRRTGPRTALALWATAAPVMTLAARRKDPALSLPVAGYVTILCAVLAASTSLDPALPASARRRVGAGAVLFLLSDTILGAREFLLEDQPAGLDAAVMATYTAGQGLIAAGVAQLGQP